MNFYVRAQLVGRNHYLAFAAWLNQSGVGEAEYFPGGWMDKEVELVAPHIRFELEADALAYVLAHGGQYSANVPLTEGIM